MSEQYPGGFITKSPPTPSGPYQNSSGYGIWNLSQQAAYTAQGLWPTAGRLPPDTKFNYVTTLLHGDGTNGAQNNTFLDSSSNAFTITRNGNTTQGSFSPYGSNWSNWFQRSSSTYLSMPTGTALDLTSGDFTVEAWVYLTESVDYNCIFSNSLAATPSFALSVEAGSPYPNTIHLRQGTPGSWAVDISSNIQSNTWYHVAATCASNVFTLWINGTSAGSTTFSGTRATPSTTSVIGRYYADSNNYYYPGYISNLRVVKGTAIYTSTFTPPTAPLTAVSGTSLLTCQSNRFVDNSASPLTITVNGVPSVQRFNPFGTSTEYSTATIGGSGYFDGTGDYLQTATSSNFNLGSGNFTIEGWAYISKTGTNGLISSRGANPVYDGLTIEITSTGMTCLGAGTSSSWDVYLSALITGSLNSWIHFAVVRNGSTFTMYYNGTSISTATYAGSMYQTANNFYIGLDSDGYMQGYLSDVRITKSAVYTTNFTPNTSPLSAIANTQLLLSMQNGAIYDNAMMNDFETIGSAQISTSVKKYGTGSISFVSTGNYLTSANYNLYNFGNGDFTVECWVYVVTGSTAIFLNNRPNGSTYAGWNMGTVGGNFTFCCTSNGSSWDIVATNTPFGAVVTGTWQHVAVVRSGTSFVGYVDGVGTSLSTSAATILANTYNFNVGGDTASNYLNGYIDDLRITKGYARYTTNFTPPTAAFPNIGPN